MPKQEFQAKDSQFSEVPVKENWLYCTKPQKYSVRAEDTFKVSEKSPEWFKGPGKAETARDEGTITVFSRLSGWIYVSAESRNRKHRLGKSSPFVTDDKFSLQNVSGLAPAWMQRENTGVATHTKFKNFKPPSTLRQEGKRMILVDEEQPGKSIFSIGDFRHDIRTMEEVNLYNQMALNQPKEYFAWKEDPKKQSYDKPVTEKIGSRKT